MPLKRENYHLSDAAKEVIKMKRRRSLYRYQKPIHALWELFSDYSNISTVHGVRYLGEKKRHWVERIFWIIAFTASVVLCTKLVIGIWHKWEQIPVIVSFEEKSTPIWQIPFPSVTICPETKAKQTLFNFTRYQSRVANGELNKNTKDDSNLDMLKTVAQICRHTSEELMKFGDNVTNSNIYKNLKKVAPGLTETISNCEWFNQKTGCHKLFHEVWTEEGLCFTFNYLNASDMYKTENIADDFPMVVHDDKTDFWDADQLIYKSGVKNPFPQRVFSASDSLTFILNADEKNIDYLCGGAVQGFKMLLHTVGEAPQISKYFYRIPLNQEVLISLRPNIMTTSDKLKEYDAQRRQCFFSSERKQLGGLMFFKKYTQRNCELECAAKKILKKCKCSTFSTPRSNGTEICGLNRLACARREEFHLTKRESFGNTTGCNCLPACTSIIYDAVLSQAKYDYHQLLHVQNNPKRKQKRQYALVSISFKENQFFASRRSELYGGIDFIANCGGIMGLFMGISLLSIVEFFYFGTLRLGCNLRRRRIEKQRIAARQELLSQVEPSAPQNVNSVSFSNDSTEIQREKRF